MKIRINGHYVRFRSLFGWVSLMTAIAVVLFYLLFSTALFFRPDRSTSISCLTKTHWQQMGGFQAFAPDGDRIGCWGTALAQLAYYHRLAPYGRVRYTTGKGFRIDKDLSDFPVDFSLFAPAIDSSTPWNTREQLARYSYYAALVVRKDFGTGKNMDLLPSSGEWERHFLARVTRYISWNGYLPYTLWKLEQVIYQELNQRRPVYLHFSNFKDVGHSVVVDGYFYKGNRFFIHLNQGQGGPTDGWYDFYHGILRPDDVSLRVIYTFRPLREKDHAR